MVKEHSRTQRVAQKMQKEIAIILHRKIKDPRVSMATVSGVKVSRDLTHAKIFITFFNYKNTSEQVKTGIHTLQNAAGFIRSLLGKAMHLRVTPGLTFIYDNSLIEGMRLSNLIRQVVQNDRLRRNITSSADIDTNRRKTTNEPSKSL